MRQHYVPRVYLKNFATKKGKEYFVNVYRKKTKENFKSNIKNICGEKNLYTLNEDDEDYFNPLIIEKGYAEFFEPLYEEAYKLLIDDAKIEITDYERSIILVAVFQFFFRNTKILNESIEYHKSKIAVTYKRCCEQRRTKFEYLGQTFHTDKELADQQKNFEEETRYSFKKDHISGFFELTKQNSFQSINIYKIIDDSKFVTSDNPLKNLNLKKSFKNPFQKISQFILPLNEKYCLFLYNDKTKEYNKIYREETENGKAYRFNSDMIENAQRFVIGNQNWITETLQWEDIIKNHYENDIHKLMALVKQMYVAIKVQGAPKEHLDVSIRATTSMLSKIIPFFLHKKKKHGLPRIQKRFSALRHEPKSLFRA